MNIATRDSTPDAAETGTYPANSAPGLLVWLLSMKWRMAVDRALVQFGLTHAQYSLLSSLLAMELSGRRPSQSELANYTGLEPLYVSKLARALERVGLIDRTPHPEDSRAVQLALTESGQDSIHTAADTVEPLFDELLAPLGGLGAERTELFARNLAALLDAPSRPPT
jgi:MarR family transcriptional regulator, organic hydroperoxide resistance regulator